MRRAFVSLLLTALCLAPPVAHAGAPFIESHDAVAAYPGMPVRITGLGFGPPSEMSSVVIDGIPHPEIETYWSENLVIFLLPDRWPQTTAQIASFETGSSSATRSSWPSPTRPRSISSSPPPAS